MVSNKILAVAIVAIVVIAAVGAFVLLSEDDDDGMRDITGRLQVYGNANNDDFIDEADLAAFDTLSNGEWDSDKYPYADANRDGKLDSEDRTIIEKILNKEEVTLYYIDGKGDVTTIGYPVDQVGLAGTMTYAVPEALDVVDRVAGRCNSSSIDEVLHSEIANLPSLGAKPYDLDPGEMAKYPRIDVIITQYSSTYDDVEEVAENARKDCIRLDVDTTEGAIHGYLLIGFILDASDRASKIAQFYDKVMDEIDDKISTLTDSQKKKTLTNYSYSLCGVNYYLTLNTTAAGAVNLTTFTNNTTSVRDNPEALLNYPDVEYQFCYSSMGWSNLTKTEMAEEWEYYAKYFTYSAAYEENYITINKDLPDICRTAFVASILYPDLFGEDYGYKVLQEWVDEFYTFMGDYDVTEKGCWVVTYDMVKDSL